MLTKFLQLSEGLLTNFLKKLAQQEDLNFLLTNRIPRITLTRFMGWWSKLEHPWIVKSSIALWQTFSDLDLSESNTKTFKSLHDCFTRELKPGLRPIHPNPNILTSPCDAIVGCSGKIEENQIFQAKGFPYSLQSLLGESPFSRGWDEKLEGGYYLTLRLTSSMYHRFHAPCDVQLKHVTYISGDTWNVNPIALKRVERLFCKNERIVMHLQTAAAVDFLMVPVAAVLVASMRLHALDVLLNLRYQGPNEIPCQSNYLKGQELGWFEHGSTIILLFNKDVEPLPELQFGKQVRMGQPLLKWTTTN